MICYPNIYVKTPCPANLRETSFMKAVLLEKEEHAFLPLNSILLICL